MKGAVAAGHLLTAQAGARILEEGGNAVDACIAAAAVSWVTESPLTGPGGGGFMLVHRARDRSDGLLDFFVAVPGCGVSPDAGGEMVHIDVPFDARTTQSFRIGAATCAVPGTVAGLAEAHRRYARLPWPELLAPAVEAARARRRAQRCAGVPARDPRCNSSLRATRAGASTGSSAPCARGTAS